MTQHPNDWEATLLALLLPVTFALAYILLTPTGGLSADRATESDTPRLPLAGAYRFMPGDDPAWADPEYDDADWRQWRSPVGWSERLDAFYNGVGWRRIHFSLAAQPRLVRPAVYLGLIGNADEVFVNGIRVGGEGQIGKWFVEAPNLERVYRIPAGILRYGAENVIAVRLMNTHLGAGVAEEDAFLGEHPDLLLEKYRKERPRRAVEAGLAAIYLLLFLSSTLFFLSEKRREYFAFALFVGSCLAILFLEGSFFYEAGLKTPLAQRLVYALCFLLPSSLLLFVLACCSVPATGAYRSLLTAAIVCACAALLFSNASYHAYLAFCLTWGLLSLLCGGAGSFLAMRAWRSGIAGFGPIFFGLVLLSLTVLFLIGIDVGVVRIGQAAGAYAADGMVLLFLLFLLHGLAVRLARLRDQARDLAGALLTAQEDERRRLALDLHDGLGQDLLAIKLNLQRWNTTTGDPRIAGVIASLSRSIAALRRIAAGLRPPFLEELGLGATVEHYVQRLAKDTGLQIIVQVREEVRLPPAVAENVFRILQESLANVMRHSGADQAGVTLLCIPGRCRLEVWDNGVGLPSLGRFPNRGMGLFSISERARLLGGSLTISPRPRGGTVVRLDLPLPSRFANPS